MQLRLSDSLLVHYRVACDKPKGITVGATTGFPYVRLGNKLAVGRWGRFWIGGSGKESWPGRPAVSVRLIGTEQTDVSITKKREMITPLSHRVCQHFY